MILFRKIEQRILYKLCLFYAPHSHWIGNAVSDKLHLYSLCSGKKSRLRSTGMAYYILPKTRTIFGEHGFCFCGLATWNGLPPDLRDVIDTIQFFKKV